MNKDHTNELDPTTPITEQGSHWWILLDQGHATPADKQAFSEWIARGPERIEAFLQAARLTKALKSKKLRWPDTPVETLLREAKQSPADIVSLFSTHSPQVNSETPRSRRKRPLMFAIAATVLVAIACTWAFLSGPQRYATAIGEQRSVVLADGSVVMLNTSSNIEVKLEKTRRTIKLMAGEALFQVAHDKARPFDVIAGNTTIRAVGTQFNVDRRSATTTVTVVEGKVSVDSSSQNPEGKTPDMPNSVTLSAGEGVTVSPRVKPHAAAANVATATAWTQRRLVFEHRPLGEVAEEFNRYNRHEIRIESRELRNQEVTGVFQANDPDSFLDFVAKIPGVKIEQQADATKVVSN
jgi:transmembrane sensor